MVVTDQGKIELAKAILDYVKEHFRYFGVGTSNVPESTPSNDLFSPIEWQRGTGIYRKEVEDIVFDGQNIVFKCKLRFNEFNGDTGSVNIYEVGIFNAKMGGQMLMRVVLPTPEYKSNTIEKTIDVKLKLW